MDRDGGPGSVAALREVSRQIHLRGLGHVRSTSVRRIMETRVFQTNLKCASCVAKLAPVLNSDPRIASWSVEVEDERKPLTVTGVNLGSDVVRSILGKAGFKALEEIGDTARQSASDATQPPISPWYKTYFPILLVFAYLAAFVALSQVRTGEWQWVSAMRNFMGGFFVVFSFFKLLNLSAFADAYASYDVAAMRMPVYGYIYPFIELGLGAAYLAAFGGVITDLVTLAVMSLSTVGVVRSLLKKHAIRCACLGTVFNLPMSKITVVEDLSMVLMSAVMIAATLLHRGVAQ